ncbi:MAG TPA: CAP domain-containing protein, partial [Polyangiaceae bacterium]|nr:CAP domain-containing protein [Polyangiaceae bacterium]
MRSAALLPLAALLALSLTACGSDSQGGGDEDDGESSGGMTSTSASALCVDLINTHRASISLPPLQRWTDAEVCSSEQARSDANAEIPHGAFSQCGEFAQNECPGWAGKPEEMIDDCLQMMWNEGPGEDFAQHGHFLNMSSEEFTMVACGFFETDDGH